MQLLQAVFRVYHCNWLNSTQKGFVENCIKVLSDVGRSKTFCKHLLLFFLPFLISSQHNLHVFVHKQAKSRAIAIPVDLDIQVNNLFVKSNNIVQKTALSWRLSVRNSTRRESVVTTSRDYRNIIERLQVQFEYAGVDCQSSLENLLFLKHLQV